MGIDNWQEVTNRKHRRTKDDDVFKISKSVYVTNFPESTSARDLWKICSVYGTVVDVFIPSKKSKAGKRFAFVRFIKVFNLDRLVENLCTIWIGRFHLFANKVRFERPHKPNEIPNTNSGVLSRNSKSSIPQHSNGQAGSYANIVNGVSSGMQGSTISPLPALVLDDSCLVDCDMSNHAMGKVKDFSSIPNLYTILKDEGFSDVKLSYLGGLWVLFEYMMNHTGVNSWFHVIQEACNDFVSDERIVWVDIEGVPLNAWSRGTFTRIGRKWEETLDLEDNADTSFGRKRLCVKTKHVVSILETFKMLLRKCSSSHNHDNGDKDATHSKDPFGIYDLLKNKKGGDNHELSPSLSHPPGFTPEASEKRVENITILNVVKNGGSILGVMEDIIRVGQIMGYSMEGCEKDLESIIGQQGENNDVGHGGDKEGEETILWEILTKFIYVIDRVVGPVLIPIVLDILIWKAKRLEVSGSKNEMISELGEIDKVMDRGEFDDATVFRRFELKHKLLNVTEMEAKDRFQKSKVKWAVEGDENSKFFHGIINKRRSQLAIRGIFVDGLWQTGPEMIKDAFLIILQPDLKGLIFFVNGSFPKGCNSSFVALIPKVIDVKFVNDFCPISLIGSVYKVVTKVLANRLAPIIVDFISDTQSTFVAGRQILDGPFILDEILHWCKRKKKQAMFFKVDFAKAYDSVRWDYLLEVLEAFGFGQIWCNWIRGTLNSAKASILINGSPSKEFSCYRGLKQGDPLASYLFILVMESLHLSFIRVVDEGLFKGIQLPGSISISRLFYADDAMFIREWSHENLKGVPRHVVEHAASSIGCSIMSNQFRYLGVMVGEFSSSLKAWDDVILKLRSRLSKWKVKTLSIGGRLTLLKSVLGASSIYYMSIFKGPRGVLKVYGGLFEADFSMEWTTRKKKSLGLLGTRRILMVSVREVHKLKGKGFDFWSHCKKRIGNGNDTRFWFDCWIGDIPLRDKFPRLFALELDKEASVAVKLSTPIENSFRRSARGGLEQHLLADMKSMLDSVALLNSGDRWVCDLASDGNFQVKDVRNFIDDLFLPCQAVPTRWVKYIPIKVNIFAWRTRQDCFPTRVNLVRRGINIESSTCPICLTCEEDVNHIFFRCDLAQLVLRRICRWWDLDPHGWSSFQEWKSWLLSIRLSSKVKSMLEGVFFVAWWFIWSFRNRSIFEDSPPRRSEIFDDIVFCAFN
ncbi:RNA-directed DNA polymerase, eukaryota [Tanacetum coccineum]|uniref:RNA-directed DNA polymerase, eukaryota n=1 Tax=Tanacetum coccineum TaxID=301880 RepID=A0ABQ5J5G0_9ASTR